MRVLVTGGLGFVGGVVSRRLLELGHDVLIVDAGIDSVAEDKFDPVNMIRGRIKDAGEILEMFKPEVVMHFAASAMVEEGERMPIEYAENNVHEWSQFLKACLKHGTKKIVHSGTCAAYGEPKRVPIDEAHPIAPVCWYGWTKFLAEQLMVQLSKAHGIEYVGFRYFNVAGTGYGIVERRRREEHLIPKALDAVEKDTELTVNGLDYQTKDGSCVRDYVHVLDLAEAHVMAAAGLVGDLSAVKNQIVNLGTGKGSSVMDVINTVEEVTRQKVRWKAGPRRPGDSPMLIADYAKAKELFGWEPKKTLTEMIKDAWQARREAPVGPRS